MLTIGGRIKLVSFLIIGVLITVYIGLHYANLGRLVGLPGHYVVKLDLSDGGGIFTNAEVTYRGVTVGRVGALNLTPTGVEVDLNVNDSAPQINNLKGVCEGSASGDYSCSRAVPVILPNGYTLAVWWPGVDAAKTFVGKGKA